MKKGLTIFGCALLPIGIICAIVFAFGSILYSIDSFFGYRTFLPKDPLPGYVLQKNEKTGEWRWGQGPFTGMIPWSTRYQAFRDAWYFYDLHERMSNRDNPENWTRQK